MEKLWNLVVEKTVVRLTAEGIFWIASAGCGAGSSDDGAEADHEWDQTNI